MKILIDASPLDLYRGWSKPDAFHGGTESYVKVLVAGLAEAGHRVHVVTGDVEVDEQRGEREWWWPLDSHPTAADCIVAVHNLECLLRNDYSADLLVLASNGVDPWMGANGELAAGVDAYPVFSQTHANLLAANISQVDPDKCFVTGLGVTLHHDETHGSVESWKAPGRIFVGNDPQRGLWHVLDVFDKLKPLVPHATLHVGYDFDRVFDAMRWSASAAAQMLWECKQRLAATEGVVNLGALSRQEVVREQLECQVHVWPSDPPNVGSQIHGLTQMECAAAGAALVLSDIEAFPEVFGDAATLLPVPGTFVPSAERRIDAQDWAEAIAELMGDPEKWSEASRKARALAEQHTWERVIGNWEGMFEVLAHGVSQKRGELVVAGG